MSKITNDGLTRSSWRKMLYIYYLYGNIARQRINHLTPNVAIYVLHPKDVMFPDWWHSVMAILFAPSSIRECAWTGHQ